MRQVAASSYHVGDGKWAAGSLLVNPTTDAIVVDTGALKAGEYLFGIVASSTVEWVYDVQHRNADNDATLVSQRRHLSAGPDDVLLPNKIGVKQGERIRVRLVAGITGTVQASIFYVEVL